MSVFTLEEAQDLLPEVREITRHYHGQIQELKERHDRGGDPRKQEELVQQINYSFSQWVKEINTLGAEVKGPWLVDFDSGDGIYYCWKFGEETIQFFHRYETGFKGRRPLELLKGSPD